jgi:DNA-binding transcriptional ArsR family regulator
VRLLGQLRMYGPATATRLAHDLGESSGATSYHLRELAKHGLVVEDEDRNRGRERWWRAAHRTTYFDMTLDDPGTKATGGEYMRAVARVYSDRMLHFSENVEYSAEVYGADWADAFTLSDWRLRVTVEQAKRLHQEINVLLNGYRDLPEEPGTKQLITQVQIFPMVEPES